MVIVNPVPPSYSPPTMAILSGLLENASTYFYLPIDEEDDWEDDNTTHSKHIGWQPLVADDGSDFTSSSSSSSSSSLSSPPQTRPSSPKLKPTKVPRSKSILEDILSENDLYKVLGIQRQLGDPDKHTLRRAYLSRSRACHPDKFPDDPNATKAFQKVSVAYDILSNDSTKRSYDAKSPTQKRNFDFFSTRPHADETLRGVLLGVFNDFLEGDLEIVRSFLRALNDLNPSLRIGEEGIDSFLLTLHSIRERALTCRTCVQALHTELSQLLELQSSYRKLSYFDIITRSRLTIQLARVTAAIPLKVEEALVSESRYRSGRSRADEDDQKATVIIPQKICLVIRGVVVMLERMENVLS